MKSYITAMLITFLLSGLLFSQTVTKDINYINDQFAEFNSYHTSFSIDEGLKLLFFYDNFGTYSIYLDKSSFNIDNGILEINCIDGDKCIYQVKKETFEGVYWDSYSMGLDGGNLSKVLDKLNEIKSITVGNNAYTSGGYSEELKYINDEFASYNSYNTSFDVDEDRKELVFYDDFGNYYCKFADVGFGYMSGSNNTLEIKCIYKDKCIDQQKINGDWSSWETYSMGLEGGNLRKVLDKLDMIKESVIGDSGSSSNKAGASR